MRNKWAKIKDQRLWVFALLSVLVLPVALMPILSSASGASNDVPDLAVNTAPFLVQDAFTDISDNGDGTKTYRIYQAPRSIYEEDGVKKVRPDNWSFFNETEESKLKRGWRGYAYAIPFESDEIIIKIGQLETSEGKISSQPIDFSQQLDEDNRTVSLYSDAYPGVDVKFTDSGEQRQKEIIIKENPGIESGEIIFWEEIDLPKGAKVYRENGKRITRSQEVTGEMIYIQMLDKSRLNITPAIVFDSSSDDIMHIDITAENVVQKIKIDRKNNKLLIGLQLSADYLNDESKVYPIVIDPTYYACGGSNNITCALSDKYFRTYSYSYQSNFTDDATGYGNDLFVGNWFCDYPAQSFGCSRDTLFTRHAFLQFGLSPSFTGLSGNVVSADLVMYHRGNGYGTDSSLRTTVKRVTTSSNSYYSNVDNNLVKENPYTTINTSSTNTWKRWNVTDTVSAWQDGSPNYGMVVEASPTWSESSNKSSFEDRLVVFRSRDYGSYSPYLEIVTQSKVSKPNLAHDTAQSRPDSFTYTAGDRVYGQVVVENYGNATANSSRVRWHFRDQITYNGAYTVDSNPISSLSPGQRSTELFFFDIPASTPPGDYYLTSWIDYEDVVDETTNGDNRLMWIIKVTAPAVLEPNLIVRYCNPDKTFVVPGETINIQCGVRNDGDGDAGLSRLGYYFDGNYVGDDYVGALQQGNEGTENYSLTISASKAAGIYVFRAKADYQDAVGESDEGDNNLSFNITVEEPSAPDADGDGFLDVEEEFIGTDPNNPDDKPAYDEQAVYYTSSVSDANQGNSAGDPVNTRTGAFEFNLTDLTYDALGTPIVASRSYNSKLAERGGKFGNGWTGSYDIYYYQDPSSKNVQLYKGGAATSFFLTSDGGSTFTAPAGESGTLSWDGGSLTYKTTDNTKYILSKQISDNISALEFIKDVHDNTIELFYKDVNGVETLYRIREPGNTRVDYAFWPSDGKVSQFEVNGVSPRRKTIFEYDSSGNMIKQTEERGYGSEAIEYIVREFSYDGQGQMLTYTDPRGTILYNDYDGEGRVIRQYEYNPRIDSAGSKRLVYTFDYQGGSIKAPGSTHCTVVANHRSAATNYTQTSCFDADEIKIYQEDGLGNFERWTHNSDGMITSFTDKNGEVMSFEYNSDRLLTKEILPDANGYHTEITYTYWGVLNSLTDVTQTVTRPSDSSYLQTRTTHYEPNSMGDILYIRYPDNKKEIFSYDSKGRVLSTKDRNGVMTVYTYPTSKNKPLTETVKVTLESGAQDLVTNYLYDNLGNITQITIPSGKIYQNEYDTYGNLRKSIDPDLNVQTYLYDHENHLVSQIDELGRTTNYTYDTDIEASLIQVDQVGSSETISTRFEYDFVGNLVKTINALGNQETYWYDDANRLQNETKGGRTLEYGYDAAGNLLSRSIDGTSRRTEYTYDARGNKLTEKFVLDGINDSIYIYGYDGLMQQTSITNPRGDSATFVYDAVGKVVSRTDVDGSVTTFKYDLNGNKVGVLYPRAQTEATLRNANGDSETYEYDELGRLINTTNALNNVTHNAYDVDGNLISMIDRRNVDGSNANHKVTFGYDNLGNLTSQTDAYGASQTFTYDAIGQLLTETDAVGRITTYVYDDFGRVQKTIDPAGAATVMTYDKVGNQLSITAADGVSISYGYDFFGRVKTETDHAGNTTHFTFDKFGNLTNKNDRRSVNTNYEYDNLNRISKEIYQNGAETTYLYDKTNNVLSSTIKDTNTGATRITAFTYDQLGRTLTVTNPEGDTETLTYDANGNVKTRTDGKNQTTSYLYDALGRRIFKTRADGKSVNYIFDSWNNLKIIDDLNGTTSYTYDDENRLLNEDKTIDDLGRQYSIGRTYNADGSLSSLTDASGKTIDYTYNNLGQLDLVKDGTTTLANYDYNIGGLNTKTTYGNGVTSNSTYDSLNRVNSITIKDGGTELFRHDYNYDKEDNRTSLIENNSRTINYTYDDLEQLTGVNYTNLGSSDDLTFTYDGFGNRTTSSTPFGDVGYTIETNSDQLKNYRINNRESVGMIYDANGSLTREDRFRLGKATQTVNYTWDAENRLSNISYKQNDLPGFMPSLPNNTMSFKYDDFGNRVKKSVNGKDSYYINDGLTVLNELDAAGDISKSIIDGIGQVAEIDATGKITYTHQDALGSTILTTDSSGAIVDTYEYDVFGQILGLSVDVGTRTLFTGQEFDPESELYYYNARYYNPRLGRFISRDSIIGNAGDVLSRNRYTYVKNNPLKYVDPTGHWGLKSFVKGIANATKSVVSDFVKAPIRNIVAPQIFIAQQAKKAVEYIAPNTNWGNVAKGFGEVALGTLQAGIGVVQIIGGVGMAITTAPTVVGAVAGVGIALFGVNNTVAGGVTTASGFRNIARAFKGEEPDKLRLNYAHNFIDDKIENEKLNTAAHVAYDVGDILASFGASGTTLKFLQKGTKLKPAIPFTGRLHFGAEIRKGKIDFNALWKGSATFRAHIGYHPFKKLPAYWHLGLDVGKKTIIDHVQAWPYIAALSAAGSYKFRSNNQNNRSNSVDIYNGQYRAIDNGQGTAGNNK